MSAYKQMSIAVCC